MEQAVIELPQMNWILETTTAGRAQMPATNYINDSAIHLKKLNDQKKKIGRDKTFGSPEALIVIYFIKHFMKERKIYMDSKY